MRLTIRPNTEKSAVVSNHLQFKQAREAKTENWKKEKGRSRKREGKNR